MSPEHYQALVDRIPEVTEIAIVAWRAGEKHFLKLLKDGLRNPVSVIAACGGEEAALATLERSLPIAVSNRFSWGLTKRSPTGAAEVSTALGGRHSSG